MGALHLPVKQGDKQANGFLYVVDYPGPLLCGHDMIQELQLLSTEHVNSLQPLDINVDTTVKAEELRDLLEGGWMKGPPAYLNLWKDVNPKLKKAHPLPYALCNKVAAKLVVEQWNPITSFRLGYPSGSRYEKG